MPQRIQVTRTCKTVDVTTPLCKKWTQALTLPSLVLELKELSIPLVKLHRLRHLTKLRSVSIRKQNDSLSEV